MQRRNVRGALGVAALSFLVGACNESNAPAEKAPEKATKSQRLENGNTVVSVDSAGVPTFVAGNLGQLPPELAAGSATALEQAALAPLLASLAPTFHLAPEGLALTKAYTDPQGDSHYRFAVSHNGIPVLGGQLRLHVRNGQIIAANTNVRSDLKADEKATIAGEVAVSAADADKTTVPGSVSEANPELFYHRVGNELKLVYVVTQRGEKEDGTPIHDLVLVDARSSDVVDRWPQVHTALQRRMHDGLTLTTLPGPVARNESDPPHADPVVNTNYDHLGTTYNCYSELFGRDSINNAGALLISTVHHRVRYVNAFWNGTQMVYGDGDGVTASNLANSLDVTAHELTHAVTDNESDLIYSGESGGLNESMSDIFGAVCEWYGAGRVVSDRIWLIGDDVWTPNTPNDALRYMANPTQDGDSLDWYPDYGSGVDVHYSSGIPNLAFYLLSQGGTHPRAKSPQVVTGIGIEKAARIWYKANVDLLLPSSNMEAAKAATEQAATQLGYDAATVTQVGNAWKAVGVGVPIPPPVSTPLEKGVPVTGISGPRNSLVYFSVEVPEGATDLTFTLAGGTGDADMYVRYNIAPTTTQYNCRPYRSGNNEVCPFPTPQQGTWYVMIRGFSAYTNTSLVVTWKGGYRPIEPGIEITGLSGAENSSQVFTVQIPEGSDNRNVHVRLRGNGNADLYVQRAAYPSHGTYDCRGVNDHSTENCNLNNVQGGKFYIDVFGAKGGFTDGTLIVTFN